MTYVHKLNYIQIPINALHNVTIFWQLTAPAIRPTGCFQGMIRVNVLHAYSSTDASVYREVYAAFHAT